MENLHFKNQSKAEIEKIPQENEDSLETQEQESGKRENITFEIDGQKIEAVKYYFEYPERIQKETGILGYERTIINPEIVISILENDTQGLLLNKYGKKMSMNEFFNEKILPTLSDGQYPAHSFNHRYGWYSNQETYSRHKSYFKEDFFLGKIYDLEKIKEESKYKAYPFSSADTTGGDYSRYHANISLYDQENKKSLTHIEKIPLGDILQYENNIKNGAAYATTTFGGLNLMAGGFYEHIRSAGTPKFEKEICFGFSFKLDGFMREYFEKTFCMYAKQNESNSKGFINTAVFLLFNQITDFNIELEEAWQNITEQEIDFLNLILEKNIQRKLTEEEINKINSMFRSLRGNLSPEGGRYGVLESSIPIFIGHKDIPQLSWGHATYANYMSEKGFNFFKFKHADHLPVREEVNSSES